METPTLDKLIGGRADGKAIWDIAIKHNVSADYAMEQLDKGLAEEREHTQDFKTRYEIALDHLYEDIEYYNKLEKMGKGGVISGKERALIYYKDILNKFKKNKLNTIDGKFYSPNDLRWIESHVIELQELINEEKQNKMETGGTIKHPKHICEGIIITDVHTNEKFEIKSLQPVGLTLEKVTSIGPPFTKEISYEEFVSKWKSGGISISNYDCANADDIFILELCFDNICKSHKIKGYETEKEERINKEKIRKRVAEAVKLDIDNDLEQNESIAIISNKNNWVRGKYKEYTFDAKVYDGGSEYGINKGRVSKLSIYNSNGDLVVNYDRGWDIKPTKSLQKIVDVIVENFDNVEEMAKGGTITQQEKVEKVMEEFKEGELTSHGKTVTDPKQAVAIALSEAGLSKNKLVVGKEYKHSGGNAKLESIYKGEGGKEMVDYIYINGTVRKKESQTLNGFLFSIKQKRGRPKKQK